MSDDARVTLARLTSTDWLDWLIVVSSLKQAAQNPELRTLLLPLLSDPSESVRELAAAVRDDRFKPPERR